MTDQSVNDKLTFIPHRRAEQGMILNDNLTLNPGPGQRRPLWHCLSVAFTGHWPHCIALHCTFHCIELHYFASLCIALHWIPLLCITLHWLAPLCIELQDCLSSAGSCQHWPVATVRFTAIIGIRSSHCVVLYLSHFKALNSTPSCLIPLHYFVLHSIPVHYKTHSSAHSCSIAIYCNETHWL